jgi:hypothetical protein
MCVNGGRESSLCGADCPLRAARQCRSRHKLFLPFPLLLPLLSACIFYLSYNSSSSFNMDQEYLAQPRPSKHEPYSSYSSSKRKTITKDTLFEEVDHLNEYIDLVEGMLFSVIHTCPASLSCRGHVRS